MRLVRLVMGLYILIESVHTKEWIFGLAGLFLSGTAIMNQGSCGVNGCQPLLNTNSITVKQVIYEEVDV